MEDELPAEGLGGLAGARLHRLEELVLHVPDREPDLDRVVLRGPRRTSWIPPAAPRLPPRATPRFVCFTIIGLLLTISRGPRPQACGCASSPVAGPALCARAVPVRSRASPPSVCATATVAIQRARSRCAGRRWPRPRRAPHRARYAGSWREIWLLTMNSFRHADRSSTAENVPSSVPRPPLRLVPPRTTAAMTFSSKPSCVPTVGGPHARDVGQRGDADADTHEREDEEAQSRRVDAAEVCGLRRRPEGHEVTAGRRASQDDPGASEDGEHDEERQRHVGDASRPDVREGRAHLRVRQLLRSVLREHVRDAAEDEERAQRRHERRDAQTRDDEPVRSGRRPSPATKAVNTASRGAARGIAHERQRADERELAADRQVERAADDRERHAGCAMPI